MTDLEIVELALRRTASKFKDSFQKSNDHSSVRRMVEGNIALLLFELADQLVIAQIKKDQA